MAPRLEEELVFQVMNETHDKQYLPDRVEALREFGFEIDSRKIKTSTGRYKFLKAYNSQDNSRRAKKKRIKERFKQVCEKEIEKFMEDPSIINARVKFFMKESCHICGKKKLDTYGICYTKLRNDNKILTFAKGEDSIVFNYCFSCGTLNQEKITDSPWYGWV